MALSATEPSSTPWLAATRRSCRSPLPCRGFSLGLVVSDNMNEDEFEERLKALRPRLHRYCARMTGSAVDGEDVLQETLIKVLRARDERVDNLEGWVFRIAHN